MTSFSASAPLDKTCAFLYNPYMNDIRKHDETSVPVLRSLATAEHTVSCRLDPALGTHGLSAAKLRVLGELIEAAGPLTLGQLAERMACVKSNITQLVDRLEADGLVRRTPDGRDRRCMRASVTEEGRGRYALGMQTEQAVERELTMDLAPDEQDRLVALLTRLNTRGAKKAMVH